jgi:hypothetical protein
LKEICLSVTVREMKRKTTVYLEDDVLKTMRVAAVRSGKRDYQVVEEACALTWAWNYLEQVGARRLVRPRRLTWRMRNCIRALIERAVFDPGLLIAGLISAAGAPRALLRRWLQGDFELVVSPALLAELEHVLLRPMFSDVRDRAGDPCVRGFATPA